MRVFILAVVGLIGATPALGASTRPAGVAFPMEAQHHDPWAISWIPSASDSGGNSPSQDIAPPPSVLAYQGQSESAQPAHAVATEYSDAYRRRATIHKYASVATLPLFAIQLALGQALYDPTTTVAANGTTTLSNNPTSKSAHAIVGASIVGLFAVNTLTGAWNLFGEARHDPEGKKMRLTHAVLMMAADVGFLATSTSGPKSERNGALTFSTDEATHRALAVTSIGIATAGYLLMLLGNH